MKKVILACVAAVAIIGSTAVYAQHRHHHHRMSIEDRAAFVDAKIAAVKAGLKLSPEQEKMWPPVEAAVRDFAKQRMALANARPAARSRIRRARRTASRLPPIRPAIRWRGCATGPTEWRRPPLA